MVASLEGQVEHGQDEEHLGKVAGRIDEVAGKEGLAGLDGSVIAPESIDFDEGSVRLFLGNAVVMILGPFLGCIELPEELPDLSSFLFRGREVSRSGRSGYRLGRNLFIESIRSPAERLCL